jgi:hypothetical protein
MSYEDIIKDSKFTYIKPPKKYQLSKDGHHIGVTFIPKCGADIRFRIGKFSLQLPKFKIDKDLPLSWKNYSDDPTSNKKFRLSTRPVNQGVCGSCFAVAVATCISDNFIFNPSNPLDYNPSISPMYILSCIDDPQVNTKCAGGNPSGVIDLIIENGISTNCCQDYYKICNASIYCNGSGDKHMDHSSITPEQHDSMIPECGYCSTIPQIYNIKNKIISYDIQAIKRHLMEYGTAIAGYIIFNNFIHSDHGKFEKTNGIYINSVDYLDPEDPDNKKYNMSEPIGGHAICIVGWGVDTISFTDRNGVTYNNQKIDYWVCRNSWSEKWGLDGYFKYAMYRNFDDLPPIQNGVAFEMNNTIHGQSGLGGIILIFPNGITENKTLKKVECNPDYTCDEIIYVKDFIDPKNVNVKAKEAKARNYYIVEFILLGLFLIVLYFLFFRGKKHRRHRKR